MWTPYRLTDPYPIHFLFVEHFDFVSHNDACAGSCLIWDNFLFGYFERDDCGIVVENDAFDANPDKKAGVYQKTYNMSR